MALIDHLEIKALRPGNIVHISSGDLERPVFNLYYDFAVTEKGETPRGVLVETAYPGVITAMTTFVLKQDVYVGGDILGILPDQRNEEVRLAAPYGIVQIEIE